MFVLALIFSSFFSFIFSQTQKEELKVEAQYFKFKNQLNL